MHVVLQFRTKCYICGGALAHTRLPPQIRLGLPNVARPDRVGVRLIVNGLLRLALSCVWWLVINGFVNATLWGAGRASIYFVEQSLKVVATTAAFYASSMGPC